LESGSESPPRIREITDEEAKEIEQENKENSKTKLGEEVRRPDSGDSQQQAEEAARNEWIKIGKQQGWLYTTIPAFFLLIISFLR
jgi:hypothetical protein